MIVVFFTHVVYISITLFKYLLQIGPVPIMRMFGITMEGNSICCHVHGFSPYLFVTAPKTFDDSHCEPFKVNFKLNVFTLMSNILKMHIFGNKTE